MKKQQPEERTYPEVIGIERVHSLIGGPFFRITIGRGWGATRTIELDELPEGITVGMRVRRFTLSIEEPGPED